MSLPAIFEANGKYYLQLKTEQKILTNFVIRTDSSRGGDINEHRYQLLEPGKDPHFISIPPEAWLSRSSFLKKLNGIGNCCFFGKSAEVRLIAEHVRSSNHV